ncbi:Hypothetical predicted protein, partial [Xyrichtys novacula]
MSRRNFIMCLANELRSGHMTTKARHASHGARAPAGAAEDAEEKAVPTAKKVQEKQSKGYLSPMWRGSLWELHME